MTKTEVRFINRAIRRASAQVVGAPAEFIQKFMTDAIHTAVEDAAEEDAGNLGAEVGLVEPGNLPQPPSFPPARGVFGTTEGGAVFMPDADPQMQPRQEIIPVEREPARPQPSLLIIPGQEGYASLKAGKKLVGTPEPLNLWREPTKKLKEGAVARRWQRCVSDLIELANSHMPAFLTITPLGTTLNLQIERLNTLADMASGAVKVEYGFKGQAGSSRSQQNIGGGTLDPMKIDRLVTSTFNIADKFVNWQQRIQDVIVLAEETFRPRPETIENRTPAKLGDVSLLVSGDPRRNAGGYGEVGGDPRSIDPRSEGGGLLVMGEDNQSPSRRRQAQGPVVPNL